MMRSARRLIAFAAASVIGALSIVGRVAAETPQEYPTRPVALVVPFAAGVSADLLFRGLAEVASKHLGQPIVIENKSGGSATLGPATVAATAKPDGYTITQIPIPVYRVPVMQKATFDPINDFTYIVLLAGYQLGAVVRADSQFKKWQDVVDYAKANPGKLTYSTIGPATSPGLSMTLASKESGIQMTHVPSKGGGESIAALMGRHVDMIVESPAWAPMVASGDFRVLLLLGSEREKTWPDVPVLREVGYSFDFDSPTGLAGPKGMHPAIVKKLHDAFKKAYDDPSMPAHYDKIQYSRRYMNTADYTELAKRLAVQERRMLEQAGLARKD